MNKKRNLQDKARVVLEFINTGILLQGCVASTTYLRPPFKTGRVSFCREARRQEGPHKQRRQDRKSRKGGRESKAHNR